jgi:hypothetical protein
LELVLSGAFHRRASINLVDIPSSLLKRVARLWNATTTTTWMLTEKSKREIDALKEH